VLVFEDVQWASGAVEFVEYLNSSVAATTRS